jgi:hypothetical protein
MMKSKQILSDLGLAIGTCTASYVRLAYRLADDEGTIQAGDMLQLSSEPTLHTTTHLRSLLISAGCVDMDGINSSRRQIGAANLKA